MQEPGPSLKRRVSQFSAGPLLNLLTPFLVLPVLAGATDTAGWAELAIGQSVGSVAAGIVAYGWQIVGPVEVARSSSLIETQRIYAESVIVRTLVLAPTLLVVVGLCLSRSPGDHRFLAASVAASVTLMGLSPSWVSIGQGRPMSIVAYEATPRVALLAASAVAILLGGSIWLYPAALASSTLIGVLLFSRRVVRPAWTGGLAGAVRARFRTLAPTMAATSAASLYSTGALMLVGLVASTQATAEMASADRLFRIGIVVIVILANALQAWVVHELPLEAASRQRRALELHSAVGVTGLIVFAVGAPSVTAFLFGPDLTPSYIVTACYGAVFAFQAVHISLVQHVLIPAGRSRAVLISTLLGAGIGVPAILLSAHLAGAEGGAAALAISEGAVLASLGVFALRSVSGRQRAPL